MAIKKLSVHLYKDICRVIEQARSYVAQTTNSSLTLMYWQIGDRINKELLDGERAAYGKQIVSELATKLSWSHFIELLSLKEDVKRDFYLTMAINENWGRDALREKIGGLRGFSNYIY